MNATKKVNVEAIKAYLVRHSTLTDAQKTAVTAAFDGCMASVPKYRAEAPTESMKAFMCMVESLIENVSWHLSSPIFPDRQLISFIWPLSISRGVPKTPVAESFYPFENRLKSNGTTDIQHRATSHRISTNNLADCWKIHAMPYSLFAGIVRFRSLLFIERPGLCVWVVSEYSTQMSNSEHPNQSDHLYSRLERDDQTWYYFSE